MVPFMLEQPKLIVKLRKSSISIPIMEAYWLDICRPYAITFLDVMAICEPTWRSEG